MVPVVETLTPTDNPSYSSLPRTIYPLLKTVNNQQYYNTLVSVHYTYLVCLCPI